MIIRLVKLSIKESFVADFEATFLRYHKAIAKQPGCFKVMLQKDINNFGVFFTQSEWESEEALNTYRNSELFGEIWPTVKPWFSDKPEAWSTIKL